MAEMSRVVATGSGARKVDVKEHLDVLFALDTKIANATPHYLSFKTKEEFLDFFTQKHKSETWVWNDQHGNLVGYLSLVDMPKEGAMEILSVAVDPDYQNKGYGRQMMEFAERQALENGRKKTILVTNNKNQPAIAFYKGIGYNAVREIANYYGDGETRILFEKILSES